MKVGILTFHRAHNYGALLQAYALKSYLEKQGLIVDIVDYWPEYHEKDYKLIPYFWNRSLLRKLKSLILLLFGFSRILKRRNGYKEFIRKYLGIEGEIKYKTENELSGIEFDVIVYGSDQIWRRSSYSEFKGFSNIYFGDGLAFVKKKITYAASMGTIDVNQHDESFIQKKLHNFNHVSVREINLQELLERITGSQFQLVLDPVFLLDKNEWDNLCKKTTNPLNGKYIFFYQLTHSKEAIEFTNLLSKTLGLKVIEIRGRVEPQYISKRYFQTANPLNFISLIKNAEIVVSTSFHGVAFSIIFEKQFYALGMKQNSGRVETLLEQLEIKNRFINSYDQIVLNETLDYSLVNIKKDQLKQNSMQFLLNSLDLNN